MTAENTRTYFAKQICILLDQMYYGFFVSLF